LLGTPQHVARTASTSVIVDGNRNCRIHAGHVVTVHIGAEVITIDLDGEDTRTVRPPPPSRSAASKLIDPARPPMSPRHR